MKRKNRRKTALVLGVGAFCFFLAAQLTGQTGDSAKSPSPSPTPVPPVAASTPAAFDQAAALAALREQIKGREKEPAEKVFKNTQTLKQVPAGRLLAIMEFGYARSLGVNCAHCHVPEKWESEDRPQKQIAREMWAMMGNINSQMLKGIKNLRSENPIVNCTTCHRGQIKPALDLPMPPKS